MPRPSATLLALAALLPPVRCVTAQVQLVPAAIEPGQWERFALRVVNQAGAPTIRVRLEVPTAIVVLGVDAPPGWTGTFTSATDSTPAAVDWTGASIPAGEFREFAFFGRLAADVRRQPLVFPVRIERQDGAAVEWSRGGDGAPPIVRIQGSTTVTTWGAFALAGGAMGVAILALVIALYRPRAP